MLYPTHDLEPTTMIRDRLIDLESVLFVSLTLLPDFGRPENPGTHWKMAVVNADAPPSDDPDVIRHLLRERTKQHLRSPLYS